MRIIYFRAKFLLTRLLRGVTFALASSRRAAEFLLTRLLRGVTGYPFNFSVHSNFYSHASCEA